MPSRASLHGPSRDSTRPGPALFIPMVSCRVWGKKQRPRSNGQEATARKRWQWPPINVKGLTCRHEGPRHARLAPRGGSARRGGALAPGAQTSAMPRRLYAERRLLHPAVAQRTAVGRKAWIGTAKPARSEESRPAISIRAILGYLLVALVAAARPRASAAGRCPLG